MKGVIVELCHQDAWDLIIKKQKEIPAEENSKSRGSEKLQGLHQVAPSLYKKFWEMRRKVVQTFESFTVFYQKAKLLLEDKQMSKRSMGSLYCNMEVTNASDERRYERFVTGFVAQHCLSVAGEEGIPFNNPLRFSFFFCEVIHITFQTLCEPRDNDIICLEHNWSFENGSYQCNFVLIRILLIANKETNSN